MEWAQQNKRESELDPKVREMLARCRQSLDTGAETCHLKDPNVTHYVSQIHRVNSQDDALELRLTSVLVVDSATHGFLSRVTFDSNGTLLRFLDQRTKTLTHISPEPE